MLHHGSIGWVHSRPRINAKKFYCKENWAKRANKPDREEIFFYNRIAVFNFRDNFRLVERGFWFYIFRDYPSTWFNNVKGLPRIYSGILRTLCSPSMFRTLIYSKPWDIQNPNIFRYIQNPGILRTWCKFRTLSNIYDGALCKCC